MTVVVVVVVVVAAAVVAAVPSHSGPAPSSASSLVLVVDVGSSRCDDVWSDSTRGSAAPLVVMAASVLAEGRDSTSDAPSACIILFLMSHGAGGAMDGWKNGKMAMAMANQKATRRPLALNQSNESSKHQLQYQT